MVKDEEVAGLPPVAAASASTQRLPLRRPRILSASAERGNGPSVLEATMGKPIATSESRSKDNVKTGLSDSPGSESIAEDHDISILPTSPDHYEPTTVEEGKETDVSSDEPPEIYEKIKRVIVEWRARQPTFDEFLSTPPDGVPQVRAREVFTISNLDRPVAVATLVSGNIAIAVNGENTVKIFSRDGEFLRCASPPEGFTRPRDMVTLSDGRLVVKDDRDIFAFDQDGKFLRQIGDTQLGKCYGLTSDGQGHLITLNSNPNGMFKLTPTQTNETDIFLLDIETGQVHQRIELVDIIEDKIKSKCRFIHFHGKKLYIVDFGLNMVYVMNLKSSLVKRFGGAGHRAGQFWGAAGIAVDRMGNMLVADAGNNRIQLFDAKCNFLGVVRIDADLRRPSRLYFDIESLEPAIFVLSLKRNNMSKIQFVKEWHSEISATFSCLGSGQQNQELYTAVSPKRVSMASRS